MRVEIKLTPGVLEPYAAIYAEALTDEVRSAAELLEQKRPGLLTAKQEDRYVVIDPKEIFMARTEDGQTVLYCEKSRCLCGKRLYELEALLGQDFMRISKGTIVNLRQLNSVEPCFNGMMVLVMKNGAKDYISRTYLPAFKAYLGL